MAFVPFASWNSRSITHLANYLSRSLPMNSSDESEGADSGFPCGLGGSPWSAVADRVGSFAGTPQPAGARVHCWFAGLDFHCLSSTLRAGTEPRRVHLGLLEAARVTQCLPQGLLATERSGTTNAPSHAPPSATD